MTAANKPHQFTQGEIARRLGLAYLAILEWQPTKKQTASEAAKPADAATKMGGNQTTNKLKG